MVYMADILNGVKTIEDLDDIITKYGLNYQDSNGRSYLHEFSKTGQVKLICHLLNNINYDVNNQDKNGKTALFESFNEEIVELLLVYRIDYKLKDMHGKTAREDNQYVKFVIDNKCSKIKDRLLNSIGV